MVDWNEVQFGVFTAYIEKLLETVNNETEKSRDSGPPAINPTRKGLSVGSCH